MIFKIKKHNSNLYNTLLFLSRNIFFYDKIKLSDTFETRLYLMFVHFSIMLVVFRKKNSKFNQNEYDSLFNFIENSLREMGLGDIAVNKKMKDINKVLYDILLKLELDKSKKVFKINDKIVLKYFNEINDPKSTQYLEFESYFNEFFDFCFEQSLDNMLREIINFKY
tara:strand:+ start:427 stop:927 length:501 start_codon:yes stop_codon:yes gene_type:complete